MAFGGGLTKLGPLNPAHRESAERLRALVERGASTPAAFREALLGVSPLERDAWVDLVLGLDALPDDGPELPRGCVPYLPCPVDALLRVVEHAPVRAEDVFVDVGSGAGRATALVHLLTGASAVGLEVQPALVEAARALATRLGLSRVSVLGGDAVDLAPRMTEGSVFFLYCPFSGARLEQLLAGLEPLARPRELKVCAVDLPLPPCAWLSLQPPSSDDLVIHRSTLLGGTTAPR